ncbi:hypothetical protein HG536_0E04360 [Torulaspora globosa]|uniref:Nucleoporin POM34 n=1 Tax=Torulaspora globosa TaxID=48254 RepID=A0A7G3ZJ39_9SACH|nr:uncharacterized protein HG536_0E04360 [Torulaspora globosa]QLL33525.1 hypothetical protein HG536_0E04360 [Torulaspora globosa]
MDNAPASTFATPSRPITREQFHSLRQKMVKESPRLYKNKILSDPSENTERRIRSAPVTPRNYVRETRGTLLRNTNLADLNSRQLGELNDDLVSGKEKPVSGELGNKTAGFNAAEPGNYENPVLNKLASRTVNKEMETQIIVTNLIVLAIWDLFTKFLKIFLDYSHFGKVIALLAQEKFSKLKLGIWIYRLNREFPWLVKRLSWSNFDTVFHLVVAYNVLGSLWRLFSKVKVSDLNLNSSQRELLGLRSNDEFADSHASISSNKKPHVILDQNRQIPRAIEDGTQQNPSVPATPFLFKSLETPLKAKQREQSRQQQRTQLDLQRQAQSASVSKVNAFGSNFDKTESRPVPWTTSQISPAGYIPSSKYAYMMSSPSPRKRM